MEETETIHPHQAKGKSLPFPESLGTEQQNFNKAILITMTSKPYSPSQVLLLLKMGR